MRSVGKGEDVGGAMESGGIGHERRARMTVLLLVRLAVAVLVILMCSWAMAIAWAAGTRGDADGLLKGPMFTLETPVQSVPEFDPETRKTGNTTYLQESIAPRLTT
jgi:hypothetical protein